MDWERIPWKSSASPLPVAPRKTHLSTGEKRGLTVKLPELHFADKNAGCDAAFHKLLRAPKRRGLLKKRTLPRVTGTITFQKHPSFHWRFYPTRCVFFRVTTKTWDFESRSSERRMWLSTSACFPLKNPIFSAKNSQRRIQQILLYFTNKKHLLGGISEWMCHRFTGKERQLQADISETLLAIWVFG